MISVNDIGFFDIAVKDGRAWFVNAYYGAIYSFDIQNFKIRLETFLPNDCFGVYQYANLAFWEKTLIIAPRKGNILLLYEIEKDIFEFISVCEKYISDNIASNLFYGVEVFGDDVFLLPGRYSALVKLSMPKKEISYIDFRDLLEVDYKKSVIFARNHRIGNICYLPYFYENAVLKFNLETEIICKITVNHNRGRGLVDAVIYDGDLLLSCKNEMTVIRVSEANGIEENFFTIASGSCDNGISNIYPAGKEIYFLGMAPMKLYKRDMITQNCIAKYDFRGNRKKYEEYSMPLLTLQAEKQIDNKQYIIGVDYPNQIVVLDSITGVVNTIEFVLSEADRKQIQKYINSLWNKSLLTETAAIDLEDFVDHIVEE